MLSFWLIWAFVTLLSCTGFDPFLILKTFRRKKKNGLLLVQLLEQFYCLSLSFLAIG